MKSKITHHETGSVSFVGKEAVNVFACIAVASAMRLYAKTGIKANRSYTPTNMLAFVKKTTGKTFKRGQYLEASEHLREFAQAQRSAITETTDARSAS